MGVKVSFFEDLHFDSVVYPWHLLCKRSVQNDRSNILYIKSAIFHLSLCSHHICFLIFPSVFTSYLPSYIPLCVHITLLLIRNRISAAPCVNHILFNHIPLSSTRDNAFLSFDVSDGSAALFGQRGSLGQRTLLLPERFLWGQRQLSSCQVLWSSGEWFRSGRMAVPQQSLCYARM